MALEGAHQQGLQVALGVDSPELGGRHGESAGSPRLLARNLTTPGGGIHVAGGLEGGGGQFAASMGRGAGWGIWLGGPTGSRQAGSRCSRSGGSSRGGGSSRPRVERRGEEAVCVWGGR